MPAAVEVYTGSVTYTSASGTDPTAINVGATGAGRPDIDNCIVNFTMRGAESGTTLRVKRHVFTATLTDNGTNLQLNFSRNESSSAETVDIEWFVVEFESSALGSSGIQTGEVSVDATTDTVAITAVSESEAAVFTSYKTDLTAWSSAQYTVELTTNVTARDQITFDCDSAGASDYTIAWQVVEFQSADIAMQHGVNSFSDSGTQAVTATDLVLKTGQQGGNSSGVRYFSMASLNSTTEIQFNVNTRGATVASGLSWQCMEFLDSTAFAQGVASISDTSSSVSSTTFTAMDTGQASALSAVGSWPNAYSTSTTTDYNIHDVTFTLDLHVDGDEVTITRAGTGGPADIAWAAVEWDTAGGGGFQSAWARGANVMIQGAPT